MMSFSVQEPFRAAPIRWSWYVGWRSRWPFRPKRRSEVVPFYREIAEAELRKLQS
jgi:hypothetical protein